MSNLQTLSIPDFAKWMKHRAALAKERRGSRVVTFLGAGCSVSSGVLAAKEQTRKWMFENPELSEGRLSEWCAWAHRKYGKYHESDLAKLYPVVAHDLFPSDEEKQIEIENICTESFPGVGYSVLAKLMTQPEYGHCFNLVITTNFDDLVARSVTLFTDQQPLAASHDSLASFVKATSGRPAVLKLHGDAAYDPKITEDRTAILAESLQKKLSAVVRESGAIVFIGYGGNDDSVTNFLKTSIDEEALRSAVYWVRSTLPNSRLCDWLNQKKAIHVKSSDFDHLMLCIWDTLNLESPYYTVLRNSKANRDMFFTRVIEMMRGINELQRPISQSLLDAAHAFFEKTHDEWSYLTPLESLKWSDPDAALREYESLLEQFPESMEVLAAYARFQRDRSKLFRIGDCEEASNPSGRLKVLPSPKENAANLRQVIDDYFTVLPDDDDG